VKPKIPSLSCWSFLLGSILKEFKVKNILIFTDVTSRSPVEVYRRFGGGYCFHLQGSVLGQAGNKEEAGRK
jgi:hypothetical protein